MNRQRIRIRFCKAGDLRMIGHRDLVRTMERLLRRCRVSLWMSEGFHPKPRMSFPSALALGVTGQNEVMEVELAEPLPVDELKDRLARQAPPGLTIHEVALVTPGQRKAQVRRATYELPVPAERQDGLRESMAALLARTSYPVLREGANRTIDLRRGIDDLRLVDGRLRLRLHVTGQGDVRPREVLAALGVESLAAHGFHLQRTEVEVVP